MDCFIYHDGLSQWWEAGAQTYLQDVLKFPLNRQLRCEGATNAGTRYWHNVVGDSPELCRGLDSHGFADLMTQFHFNVSLSSVYPVDDIRCFHSGTPKEVGSSLLRSWEMEPTSERIIEDIEAFPRVLQVIIDNEGCVVPDECFKHGRRFVKLKGEGVCKSKPRKSQRIATLCGRPLHPDVVEAYESLKVKAKQMVAMTDAITAATIDRLGELDLVENIVIVD